VTSAAQHRARSGSQELRPLNPSRLPGKKRKAPNSRTLPYSPVAHPPRTRKPSRQARSLSHAAARGGVVVAGAVVQRGRIEMPRVTSHPRRATPPGTDQPENRIISEMIPDAIRSSRGLAARPRARRSRHQRKQPQRQPAGTRPHYSL
jgi:hypothetical protein